MLTCIAILIACCFIGLFFYIFVGAFRVLFWGALSFCGLLVFFVPAIFFALLLIGLIYLLYKNKE
jgi:hypothetical protein